MTLLLCAIVSGSVVMCADTLVQTNAGPQHDAKLCLKWNRFGIGTFGNGPPEHVPTALHDIRGRPSTVYEAAILVHARFSAHGSNASAMGAVVGGVDATGPSIWRVAFAPSAPVLEDLTRLGHQQLLAFPLQSPQFAQSYNVTLPGTVGALEAQMLGVQAAFHGNNPSIAGPPCDVLVLQRDPTSGVVESRLTLG